MARRRSTHAGFTLVEALITVAVLAVLLAVAVPSMYEFIMRKKVEGAADELLGDVRMARSVQARDNTTTVIKFGRTDSKTCYVIYQPTSLRDCDCTAATVCAARNNSRAVEIKTVQLPASGHVTIAPNDDTTMLAWNAVTGLPAEGVALNVQITAPSGGEARLTTSATGRGQLCSVSGHLSAYPACPTTTPAPAQ